MEILNTILNSKAVLVVLEAVLTILASYIAKKISTYLNTKTKKDVAKTVALAVEQMYKGLHGEEKLKKGLDMFASMLNEKGIKASATELQYLLESAVGEFNKVFYQTTEIDEDITSEVEVEE